MTNDSLMYCKARLFMKNENKSNHHVKMLFSYLLIILNVYLCKVIIARLLLI